MQEDIVISYNNPESFKEGLQKLMSKKHSKIDVQNIYRANYNFDSGIRKIKEMLFIHKIRY